MHREPTESEISIAPVQNRLVGNSLDLTQDRFAGLNFSGKKPEFSVHIRSGVARTPAWIHQPGNKLFLIRQRTPKSDPIIAESQVEFVQTILHMTGLEPAGYRIPPLIRRVSACLRALKAETTDAALAIISADSSKLTLALNTLLIGTTAFFRDTPVFDEIENRLIPKMIASNPYPRVWSAACSDGAELYSVAMLLSQAKALGHKCLLGTDFRSSAIESARKANYSSTAVADVRTDLQRYLVMSENWMAISSEIHDSIEWRQSDVLTRNEPGKWNMILCRNLGIYLEANSMASLWKNLADALVPGGYLIVGRAEKPQIKNLARVSACIYQKSFTIDPEFS